MQDARAGRLELAPQRADPHLDQVRVIGPVSPDLGEQFGLGHGAAAAGKQIAEQPQLGRGQVQRPAIPPGGVRGLVQHEATSLDGDRHQPAGAAQQRMHPGQQLGQRERLDQIVIGAGGEPGQPVVQPVARGQEQDGQVGAVAQHPGQGQPVRAGGQHDVQDSQVGPERVGHRPQPGAVGFGAGHVAGLSQRGRDRVPDRGLVLDQEHPRGGISHSHSVAHRN